MTASGASSDRVMPRRHDLDALRAGAMLLGIALHACLSFAPFPWPVQDVKQSIGFLLFFTVVHGFRMQLFFLVSGYFTAMLWRRRGVNALIQHRAKRILLPCMLGLITIVPALDWASEWAMDASSSSPPPAMLGEAPLIAAVRHGDNDAVARLLADQVDPNVADRSLKFSALGWAAIMGNVSAAEMLADHGAQLHARAADGSTPLHSAAFLGRADVARVLVVRGANPTLRNNKGERPMDATHVDWRTTRFIGGLFRAPLVEVQLREGRREIRSLLNAHSLSSEQADQAERDERARDIPARYMAAISGRQLTIPWFGMEERLHLVHTPFFHHLWFLWFLCWLAAIFSAYAWLRDRWRWNGPPNWLFKSPWCLAWVIPVTLIPQWFMGEIFPTFGPDTSVGLMPQPHVLLYYGIFFGFGVCYYDCDDQSAALTRGWPLMLLVGIFVAYPLGLIAIQYRPLGAPAQTAYAWLMTLGLMGCFRAALRRERPSMRYLSDASYWLYLAHVPLVIVVQQWIRAWPLPLFVKFAFVLLSVTAILLAAYQLAVRYTWVGRMLNGPRTRPEKT